MTEGAQDHHLPLENKLDDVRADLTVLTSAVNNLKTTLTNLNVSPPTAESPWAVKLIGKSGWTHDTNEVVSPSSYHTLVNVTGSGQVNFISLRAVCVNDFGHREAYLSATIDGTLYLSTMLMSFACYPGANQTWTLGPMGCFVAAATTYGIYYAVPIHYTSSLLLRFFNRDSVQDSTIHYFVSYTNLPTP